MESGNHLLYLLFTLVYIVILSIHFKNIFLSIYLTFLDNAFPSDMSYFLAVNTVNGIFHVFEISSSYVQFERIKSNVYVTKKLKSSCDVLKKILF